VLSTARAGNVIGGGDDSENRLLPDLLRGFAGEGVCVIRNPNHIRPWQHVLDPLRGYVALADYSLAGLRGGAWNFGPATTDELTVADVARLAAEFWGPPAAWEVDASASDVRETRELRLDSSHASHTLGWRCLLQPRDAVQWTVDWERQYRRGQPPLEVCQAQIDRHWRI